MTTAIAQPAAARRPPLRRPWWNPLVTHRPDGIAVVSFGHGQRPLVILPGLTDTLLPAAAMPRYNAWCYRRYAPHFSVHIACRPPARRGASTRSLAAAYARYLAAFGEPVDILGVSLGSMIAQHVAVDHPQLVRRVVLCFGGHYGSPATLERGRRWRELAAAGRWRALYADMAAAACTGVRRVVWRSVMGWLCGTPCDAASFVHTIDASLGHDLRADIHRLRAPALVIAGEHDELFHAAAMREMAAALPRGSLVLLPCGHEGMISSGADVDAHTVRFLSRK